MSQRRKKTPKITKAEKKELGDKVMTELKKLLKQHNFILKDVNPTSTNNIIKFYNLIRNIIGSPAEIARFIVNTGPDDFFRSMYSKGVLIPGIFRPEPIRRPEAQPLQLTLEEPELPPPQELLANIPEQQPLQVPQPVVQPIAQRRGRIIIRQPAAPLIRQPAAPIIQQIQPEPVREQRLVQRGLSFNFPQIINEKSARKLVKRITKDTADQRVLLDFFNGRIDLEFLANRYGAAFTAGALNGLLYLAGQRQRISKGAINNLFNIITTANKLYNIITTDAPAANPEAMVNEAIRNANRVYAVAGTRRRGGKNKIQRILDFYKNINRKIIDVANNVLIPAVQENQLHPDILNTYYSVLNGLMGVDFNNAIENNQGGQLMNIEDALNRINPNNFLTNIAQIQENINEIVPPNVLLNIPTPDEFNFFGDIIPSYILSSVRVDMTKPENLLQLTNNILKQIQNFPEQKQEIIRENINNAAITAGYGDLVRLEEIAPNVPEQEIRHEIQNYPTFRELLRPPVNAIQNIIDYVPRSPYAGSMLGAIASMAGAPLSAVPAGGVGALVGATIGEKIKPGIGGKIGGAIGALGAIAAASGVIPSPFSTRQIEPIPGADISGEQTIIRQPTKGTGTLKPKFIAPSTELLQPTKEETQADLDLFSMFDFVQNTSEGAEGTILTNPLKRSSIMNERMLLKNSGVDINSQDFFGDPIPKDLTPHFMAVPYKLSILPEMNFDLDEYEVKQFRWNVTSENGGVGVVNPYRYYTNVTGTNEDIKSSMLYGVQI